MNLPMFGREQFHPDVDKLVGDFTSSLMLDLDLTKADTPIKRAHEAQQTLHATAEHSSYSGLSVLRDLTRHHGSPTLAPFVFTSALGLGDLFAGEVTAQFGRPVWTISQGPQVLLDAQVTPVAEGLMINWDVREDAFRPGVADAMFGYHVAELERLATDESAWEATDPPAVTAAQQAVRESVNSTTAPSSGEALHDGFFRSAAARPEAPAVFSSDGDLTYAELREQVLAVAAALAVAGVRRGDAVAVLGPKNVEQVIALLAIATAGAVYVPVGVDHPAERASRMLKNATVRMVLMCGDQPPSATPGLTITEALRVGRRDTGFVPAAVDPEQLAYILFTSGSTGEPKGVEMPHDAAMNTVEFINAHFAIGPADRCLALSTLEGDLSVLDVFATLRAGGSIVVVDEEHRRDPDAWARLIERHRVTVLNFMPGWLEMLLEVDGDLSSVRVVPTGGDWVRTEMVRRLRNAAPQVRFAGLGGATETAIHNTICEPGELLPPDWTAVPFGRPLPNNACRVVATDGADCPDWVPGELWVSGRGIARGYRGRPDLTAERFVVHDGRTWYRTGDLARYLPDGQLEFVGRADHRVKISGYRVELGEVESALRRIDGVAAAVAAVVAPPGDLRGEQLAAIVDVTDPRRSAGELRSLDVGDRAAAHGAGSSVVRRPHSVHGGRQDRPQGGRRAAGAHVAERADGHGYRAPATALERALADIIASVLRTDRVGAGRRLLRTRRRFGARDTGRRAHSRLARRPRRHGRRHLRGAHRRRAGASVDRPRVAQRPARDCRGALPGRRRHGTRRGGRRPGRVVGAGAMTARQLDFAPWVKRFPGQGGAATVVFPHAGGAAAAYRPLAKALCGRGHRNLHRAVPAARRTGCGIPPRTRVAGLAAQLFDAGAVGPSWARCELFGHCMGAVVAFEFARIAEGRGLTVRELWASAGQAPSTVAEAPPLPTSDSEVLADMVDLGGTDPRLLEDDDFVELLVLAVRADYRAFSRYSCRRDVRITADIHALRGDRDHRISREWSDRWESHTAGRFTLSMFDGGHFYLNEHLNAIAALVSGG